MVFVLFFTFFLPWFPLLVARSGFLSQNWVGIPSCRGEVGSATQEESIVRFFSPLRPRKQRPAPEHWHCPSKSAFARVTEHSGSYVSPLQRSHKWDYYSIKWMKKRMNPSTYRPTHSPFMDQYYVSTSVHRTKRLVLYGPGLHINVIVQYVLFASTYFWYLCMIMYVIAVYYSSFYSFIYYSSFYCWAVLHGPNIPLFSMFPMALDFARIGNCLPKQRRKKRGGRANKGEVAHCAVSHWLYGEAL